MLQKPTVGKSMSHSAPNGYQNKIIT